jgi:hypothetical protein
MQDEAGPDLGRLREDFPYFCEAVRLAAGVDRGSPPDPAAQRGAAARARVANGEDHHKRRGVDRGGVRRGDARGLGFRVGGGAGPRHKDRQSWCGLSRFEDVPLRPSNTMLELGEVVKTGAGLVVPQRPFLADLGGASVHRAGDPQPHIAVPSESVKPYPSRGLAVVPLEAVA